MVMKTVVTDSSKLITRTESIKIDLKEKVRKNKVKYRSETNPMVPGSKLVIYFSLANICVHLLFRRLPFSICGFSSFVFKFKKSIMILNMYV